MSVSQATPGIDVRLISIFVLLIHVRTMLYVSSRVMGRGGVFVEMVLPVTSANETLMIVPLLIVKMMGCVLMALLNSYVSVQLLLWANFVPYPALLILVSLSPVLITVRACFYLILTMNVFVMIVSLVETAPLSYNPVICNPVRTMLLVSTVVVVAMSVCVHLE